MHFHKYFKRTKGAGATADAPALGVATDPVPTVSTKAKDGKDNVLSSKVGVTGHQIERLAIGYWYEGGGASGDIDATVWAYDRNSEKWYKAAAVTLKNGELAYARVPYLADPPQTAANLGKPTSGGAEYMVCIPDPGAGVGDGIFHFVVGADFPRF